MRQTDIGLHLNALISGLRGNQLQNGVQHFAHMEVDRLQLHLAAFDLGHIQDVVNQPQQIAR